MAQELYFTHVDFEPTVQDWLEYATQAHLNQKVIDYITDHPEQLDCNDCKETELVKAALNSKSKCMPSRRSWKRVADMLDEAEKDGALSDQFKLKCLSAIAVLVGDSNAANFSEYLMSKEPYFDQKLARQVAEAHVEAIADTTDMSEKITLIFNTVNKEGF